MLRPECEESRLEHQNSVVVFVAAWKLKHRAIVRLLNIVCVCECACVRVCGIVMFPDTVSGSSISFRIPITCLSP